MPEVRGRPRPVPPHLCCAGGAARPHGRPVRASTTGSAAASPGVSPPWALRRPRAPPEPSSLPWRRVLGRLLDRHRHRAASPPCRLEPSRRPPRRPLPRPMRRSRLMDPDHSLYRRPRPGSGRPLAVLAEGIIPIPAWRVPMDPAPLRVNGAGLPSWQRPVETGPAFAGLTANPRQGGDTCACRSSTRHHAHRRCARRCLSLRYAAHLLGFLLAPSIVNPPQVVSAHCRSLASWCDTIYNSM